MLNKIWLSFFIISFLAAVYAWLFNNDITVFNAIVNSIFGMAKLSAEIAIGVIVKSGV